MNLNTLNIKYFATTFLLVFICVMNNLNAQNTLNRDKIEIIIGSYKNENNAYLHKIKLKKKGFKEVRVLPKKNEFFKVSINQFKTLKETNQFIVPRLIRHRYKIAYNINIFSVIKKISGLKKHYVNFIRDRINQIKYYKLEHNYLIQHRKKSYDSPEVIKIKQMIQIFTLKAY